MQENIFKVSLQDADVVFAFLWPAFMAKLEGKVLSEMPKGSYFVSYYHKFPNLVPMVDDKKHHLRIYQF